MNRYDCEQYPPMVGIRLKPGLPFLEDIETRLAIYYEPQYDETINHYFVTHYEEAVRRILHARCQLVYMPRLLEDHEAIIGYRHPGAHYEALFDYSAQDFYNTLSEYLVIIQPFINGPVLLVPDMKNSMGRPASDLKGGLIPCHVIQLHYENDEQFGKLLDAYVSGLIPREYNALSHHEGNDYADWQAVNGITAEINMRILQLSQMGVSDYLISQLVKLPTPKLSRLLITNDYKIILPDYDNLKITMPTLSKTLYFLYLRHPEGILFKHLCDHRDELSELYRTISPREDMATMERSIDDIVDSTRNSVNEKCSRIRAAFVEHFCDDLARNYYITGKAGEPKSIVLDRTMLVDESGLQLCNVGHFHERES